MFHSLFGVQKKPLDLTRKRVGALTNTQSDNGHALKTMRTVKDLYKRLVPYREVNRARDVVDNHEKRYENTLGTSATRRYVRTLKILSILMNQKDVS